MDDPTPPPAPAPAAGPPGFVEPSFGARVLARFTDSLLLFVLLAPLLILLTPPDGDRRRWAAASLVVGVVYEVGMLAWKGATVGKLLLGLRIVDRTTGGVPAPPWIALRSLVLTAGAATSDLVPALALPASLFSLAVVLSALPPPWHRGLHDRAARTVVTSVRRTAPAAP